MDLGIGSMDSEGGSVSNLLRSISVLDKWLENNEGALKDKVRVQRVKHWREVVLRQFKRSRL